MIKRDETIGVDDKEINSVLNLIREEKVPACPPDFESRVLRRIRLRKEKQNSTGSLFGLTFLADLSVQKAFAIPALFLAVFSSVFISGFSQNPNSVNIDFAKEAFHFQVFTDTYFQGLDFWDWTPKQ